MELELAGMGVGSWGVAEDEVEAEVRVVLLHWTGK